MFAKVCTALVTGIQGVKVSVETDVAKSNMPSFCIVGLGDAAVRESKERIGSAIRNSGFYFPVERVTVNLAPADIKKEGTAFDLPVAVSVLISSHQIFPRVDYENTVIIGELSLSGEVMGVKGVLPVVASLREQNFKTFIVPFQNAAEAALTGEGISVLPAKTLNDVCLHLTGEKPIREYRADESRLKPEEENYDIDMSEVKGHAAVKRAMEIAAAGGHNMLMIGPPGSGKSMLAKRFATILPDMSREEMLTTTKIYSAAGMLNSDSALIAKRPFRSPHHTVTPSALVGGGLIPRPGEVSYANAGVLFLDEFAEFPRASLEVLRQPMQDKTVTVTRLNSSAAYPSDFILLAGMNPCPCGYLNDKRRECKCSASAVEKYRSHVSGPLLDRIDIVSEVAVETYENLTDTSSERETSAEIRARVTAARRFAEKRLKEAGVSCNSHLSVAQIEKYCKLGENENSLMKRAFEMYSMSARSCHKTLLLARTIADLSKSDNITLAHLSEALQYRQT